MWTGEEKATLARVALTEINPDYDLDFWQEWYLKTDHKFLIVNKSRRVGWSYITSLKAVIEAIHPTSFRYQMVFVSYGMRDAAGKILDARNALMNIPEDWRKQVASDSKTSLEFWDDGKKSKSQLISLPSVALRGFGTSNPWGGVCLDEFAFHANDASVYESALPCLARGGLLSIGSTPLMTEGLFYEILTKTDEFKNYIRLNIPWWFASALCTDVSTAIDEAPKMNTVDRVERFGTEILQEIFTTLPFGSFIQEFECQFTDETEAFISMKMILACTPQSPNEQFKYEGLSEFLNGTAVNNVAVAMNEYGEVQFANMVAPAYDPEIHGDLYAGWDMGRKKDASIFTLIGVKGDKKHVWMSYELKNVKFDEQRKFAKLALSSLPIRRFYIDASGLGMDFAEWAEDEFPTIAHGVQFTNETKEIMANQTYLCFDRREYVLPMDKPLHADIYSIRRTTTAMKYNRYEGSTKDSHADRFWSLALGTIAIQEDSNSGSKFYQGYRRAKGKSDPKAPRKKFESTGNPELDRLRRQIRRQQRGRS
jgi:phage FluMu gp28-like protein